MLETTIILWTKVFTYTMHNSLWAPDCHASRTTGAMRLRIKAIIVDVDMQHLCRIMCLPTRHSLEEIIHCKNKSHLFHFISLILIVFLFCLSAPRPLLAPSLIVLPFHQHLNSRCAELRFGLHADKKVSDEIDDDVNNCEHEKLGEAVRSDSCRSGNE